MRLRPCFLLLSVLLSACATSPTGRTQLVFMPDTQLNQMGLQAFDALKKDKPVNRDSGTRQYVQCVAGHLVKQVGGRWEVVVFDDSSANAFALPGNKIGVHTGLLKVAQDQHQLAAVIGHEIGHVLARHSNERMSQEMAVSSGMALVQAAAAPQTALGQTAVGLLGLGAQYGVLMPYSRAHESEADIIGLKLMAQAGFDPNASVQLWRNMATASSSAAPPEFLSTHPSHATRIQQLQQALDSVLPIWQQTKAQGNAPQCQARP
ncbi:MAG: M48 family metallopeptidase [Methylococcales bacterium]|nr:M48 family metallopeptidase [Methylococcales bacterium]